MIRYAVWDYDGWWRLHVVTWIKAEMKMFKMFINIIKLLPLHIVTEIGSGRVTGSPGQLLPGRVGSRVNSFDPVPALQCASTVCNHLYAVWTVVRIIGNLGCLLCLARRIELELELEQKLK